MDSGAEQEELCVYNDSPDFLFSSLKEFPLFLGTCVWFTIRPHVQNCNSLSFQNEPILLEKYLTSYFFKINSIVSHLCQSFLARISSELVVWHAGAAKKKEGIGKERVEIR